MNPKELLEKVQHGELFFPFQVYQPFLNQYNPILLEHWHPHMELSYIQKGSAFYTINFQEYHVHEGDILIIPPEYLHSGKSISGIYNENLTIIFDPAILMTSQLDSCTTNFITPLINNPISIPFHIKASNKNIIPLVSILFQLADVFQQKRFGYELQIKSLLYQLIFQLYQGEFIRINKTTLLEEKVSENVKSIIEYIKVHYRTPIYIEDIANQVGYSPQYLSRFFKKATNMSCAEYINRVRINKAAQLLCSTKKSITEISFDCGFRNVSYFLKKFRESYHITPKEYRNSYQQTLKTRP